MREWEDVLDNQQWLDINKLSLQQLPKLPTGFVKGTTNEENPIIYTAKQIKLAKWYNRPDEERQARKRALEKYKKKPPKRIEPLPQIINEPEIIIKRPYLIRKPPILIKIEETFEIESSSSEDEDGEFVRSLMNRISSHPQNKILRKNQKGFEISDIDLLSDSAISARLLELEKEKEEEKLRQEKIQEELMKKKQEEEERVRNERDEGEFDIDAFAAEFKAEFEEQEEEDEDNEEEEDENDITTIVKRYNTVEPEDQKLKRLLAEAKLNKKQNKYRKAIYVLPDKEEEELRREELLNRRRMKRLEEMPLPKFVPVAPTLTTNVRIPASLLSPYKASLMHGTQVMKIGIEDQD